MKQGAVLRAAIWLADVSSSRPDGESFAGDLLELYAAGHSRWWCLAQSLRRATSAVERYLRSLLVPFWYCAGFVLLHPSWQRLCAPSASRFLAQYRGTTQWPGSAVLEIAAGLLPAILFVWVGIFVYSILRHQSLKLHPVPSLLSLNVGVCLLFLAMVLRLDILRYDLRLLSRTDFYYPLIHAHLSVLLLLSLFGAVLVLPREERPRQRRRHLARLLRRHWLMRFAASLGRVALLVPHVSG